VPKKFSTRYTTFFIDLEAHEDPLAFPVLYTNAKQVQPQATSLEAPPGENRSRS